MATCSLGRFGKCSRIRVAISMTTASSGTRAGGHFFGIIGDVTGPGEIHGVEDSLAHATSRLMEWTVHPPALTATGVWPEEVTCFAPYVIEHDGCFYMLYCVADAQRTQRICLATSTDLFNWERFPGIP